MEAQHPAYERLARSIFAAVLALLAVTTPARADAPPGYFMGSYSYPQAENRDIHLAALGVGHLMAPFDWLDWANDARGFYARGTLTNREFGREDVSTFGTLLVTRLRPRLVISDDVYVFPDAGVGLVFSFHPFPTRGTRWNFTQEWGGGMAIRVARRRFVELGIRRSHVSNGKGLDETINPSYDSIVFFLNGTLRPD